MSDHIGDANKMIGETPRWRCTKCGREGAVGRCCGDETRDPLNDAARLELKISDTPRRDAHNWHDGDYDDPLHALSDFAGQLERELNAANSEVERLTRKVAELYEGAEEQKKEIKSLRNQIDRMIGFKNEKDRQLCNLLNICRSNGIDVSSQDLLNGREEA